MGGPGCPRILGGKQSRKYLQSGRAAVPVRRYDVTPGIWPGQKVPPAFPIPEKQGGGVATTGTLFLEAFLKNFPDGI